MLTTVLLLMLCMLCVAPSAQAEEGFLQEGFRIEETGMQRRGKDALPKKFNLFEKDAGAYRMFNGSTEDSSWAYAAGAAFQNTMRAYQADRETVDISDMIENGWPSWKENGDMKLAESIFAGRYADSDSGYPLPLLLETRDWSDPEKIKRAVRAGITPQTALFFDEDRYVSEDNAYYDPGADQPNNYGLIVGWDDEFPAGSFQDNYVTEDGAWLVNLGAVNLDPEKYELTEEAKEKLIWVSYMSDLGKLLAYQEVDENGDSWCDHLYQHDMYGRLEERSGSEEEYVNLFKMKSTPEGKVQKLQAISFWTLSENQEYEIRIEVDHSGDNNVFEWIEQTDPVKLGVIEEPGYHTVKLDEPFLLSGSHFAVGLRLLPNSSGKVKIAVEKNQPGMSEDQSIVEDRVSFYYDSGKKAYMDMAEHWGANHCIKALVKYDKLDEPQELKDAQVYNETPYSTGGDSMKPWTITFNKELDAASCVPENIKIYNADSYEKHSVAIKVDGKKLTITPEWPYKEGERYWILLSGNLRSTEGKKMKIAFKLQFEVRK